MRTDNATQSDIDALTALNRDYIHSVQQGDVQRFDEILAEDFLCSNPDGSLVDKNQFLAQTARPVTISGLSVQDVKVRILGTERATEPAKSSSAPTWKFSGIRPRNSG